MTSKEYRAQYLKTMSEDEHQKQLIRWLNKFGIYYEVSSSGVWLPNPHTQGSHAWTKQNNYNRKAISKLKKTGLQRGQADIKIYLKDIELHIELKAIGGKPTPDQLKVQKIIRQTTYAKYEIIEGYERAIEFIESHFV